MVEVIVDRTITVIVGTQPAVRKFSTVEEMLAVRGRSGDLAYCYNNPDTFYKWSIAQKIWIIASV